MSDENEVYRKSAEALVARCVQEKLKSGVVSLRAIFMAGDKFEVMNFGIDYDESFGAIESVVDSAISPGSPIKAMAVCREVEANIVDCGDESVFGSGGIDKDAVINEIMSRGEENAQTAIVVMCLLSIKGGGCSLCFSVINGDHASDPAWADDTIFHAEGK